MCGIKDHFFRFGSWLVLLIFFRIDEPRILDLRFFAILLKVMDSRNWMFWFLWNSFKKDFHRILDMDFGFHRNNSILFSFHFIGKCFGFRNLDFWFGSLFYSINFLIQRWGAYKLQTRALLLFFSLIEFTDRFVIHRRR